MLIKKICINNLLIILCLIEEVYHTYEAKFFYIHHWWIWMLYMLFPSIQVSLFFYLRKAVIGRRPKGCHPSVPLWWPRCWFWCEERLQQGVFRVVTSLPDACLSQNGWMGDGLGYRRCRCKRLARVRMNSMARAGDADTTLMVSCCLAAFPSMAAY